MPTHTTGRSLLKRRYPAEIEAAIEQFFREWNDTLDPLREDLVDAVRSGEIDPSQPGALQAAVDARIGNYANDIEVVFREGAERGAEAGRAVAARRFNLDIAFDQVPDRTIRELDDWVTTLSQEVPETMGDEITRFLQSAHEEGLSVPDIAQSLNEDLFDGRLQGSKAEQLARDNSVAPSNAGNHSAFEDADSVIAEEWLATADSRTRDSHADADGQVVAVDATFLVNGHEARHPGDQQLPVEELTNCRCVLTPRFADEFTADERARLGAGERL